MDMLSCRQLLVISIFLVSWCARPKFCKSRVREENFIMPLKLKDCSFHYTVYLTKINKQINKSSSNKSNSI